LVNVIGNPAAGIQSVWTTYTAVRGPYAGQWQSIDLDRDPNDSTLWQGTLPLSGTNPLDIHYLVQAVNGVGLVTLMTNMGTDYIPGSVTPNRAPTSLTLSGAALSGPYGTETSFSAVLTSDGVPLSDMLIEFGLGSLRSQAKTDSTGLATVNIPLLSLPNDYVVRASFRGDATYQLSSAETIFTIDKQATNLVLSPATATGLPETSALLVATLTDATGRRLSEKTVFFVVTGPAGSYSVAEITDYAGRAMLGNVPLLHGAYTVNAYFSGPILLSTGETVTLEDDRYLPSSDSATLTVLNHPPVAANDTYGVESNHTLSVSAPGVLGNDRDGDNDPLTASLVSGVAHGTLTLKSDGSFNYTPQPDYAGQDTFTYSIADGFGGSDTAVVAINIHAVNRPPDCSSAFASPISVWAPNGDLYPVGVEGVSDPDGDVVTVTFTGIWQDEPVSSNGPDGFISSNGSLAQVRAKRAGNGDGRVYHLYFTASDPSGLSCTGKVRVAIVSHDQANNINIDQIDQGPLYDSTRVPRILSGCYRIATRPPEYPAASVKQRPWCCAISLAIASYNTGRSRHHHTAAPPIAWKHQRPLADRSSVRAGAWPGFARSCVRLGAVCRYFRLYTSD
jgi:hypothetical protein